MKQLSLGKTSTQAIVDDEDYERCLGLRWQLEPHGYVNHTVWKNGKPGHLRLHEFILGKKAGVYIDHKNGNKLDNQKDNLRFATQSQNIANSRIQIVPKTSRFKGVRLHGVTGKWTAQIKVNYIQKYLGSFVNEEDAARAYNAAALKEFGEFARLNPV